MCTASRPLHPWQHWDNHSIYRTLTMPLLERWSALGRQLSNTLRSVLTVQPSPQHVMSAATGEHNEDPAPNRHPMTPRGRHENTAASPPKEPPPCRSCWYLGQWPDLLPSNWSTRGKQQITLRASLLVTPGKSRRITTRLNCRTCRSKTRLSCKPHARHEARLKKLASRTVFFVCRHGTNVHEKRAGRAKNGLHDC